MKSKLFTSFLLSIALYTTAYATDLYRPSRNVELRLPSVPLIVSDPNFSIWSPCDKLMDGTTLHWTDAPKSLIGALRVDGKSYRFLGKEKLDLQAIAPMTDTEISQPIIGYLWISTTKNGNMEKPLSEAVISHVSIQNGANRIATFMYDVHLI